MALFQEFSVFFGPDELEAMTAAYNAVWSLSPHRPSRHAKSGNYFQEEARPNHSCFGLHRRPKARATERRRIPGALCSSVVRLPLARRSLKRLPMGGYVIMKVLDILQIKGSGVKTVGAGNLGARALCAAARSADWSHDC